MIAKFFNNAKGIATATALTVATAFTPAALADDQTELASAKTPVSTSKAVMNEDDYDWSSYTKARRYSKKNRVVGIGVHVGDDVTLPESAIKSHLENTCMRGVPTRAFVERKDIPQTKLVFAFLGMSSEETYTGHTMQDGCNKYGRIYKAKLAQELALK